MDYRTITEAHDVTSEILEHAEFIYDGWYADGMNWPDFIDRLDGMELSDGSRLDLGPSTLSPAIKLIKKHIRDYRKVGGVAWLLKPSLSS